VLAARELVLERSTHRAADGPAAGDGPVAADGPAAADSPVARLARTLARELGWNAARTEGEIERFCQEARAEGLIASLSCTGA
jgi:hypothetical protein